MPSTRTTPSGTTFGVLPRNTTFNSIAGTSLGKPVLLGTKGSFTGPWNLTVPPLPTAIGGAIASAAQIAAKVAEERSLEENLAGMAAPEVVGIRGKPIGSPQSTVEARTQAGLEGGERGPEPLLRVEDPLRLASHDLPLLGIRLLRLARGPGGERKLRPLLSRLGGDRRLLIAGLLQKARVHLAEVAAARPAALDHLVQEARAPLPILGGLRPAADLGAEAPQRGQPLEVTERRLEHPTGSPLDRLRGVGDQVAAVDMRSLGQVDRMTLKG